MKVQFLTRMSIQGSLLISLVSCSDGTQFAEKTLPAAIAAAQTSTDPLAKAAPTTYDSTAPTGQTVPADGSTPTDGSATNPDGTNPDGTGTGTGSGGTGTGGTAGTGTGGTGTGTGGTGTGGTGTGGTGTGTGGTGTGGGGTTPTPPGEVFSVCSTSPDKSIVSQLYSLPPNTSALPDFSTMVSVGDVCVGQLNIADRDFTQGFPGVSDIFEWFALDMRFKVTITTPGSYKFYLNSDDGSIMSIDGTDVINNDGTHSQIEKTGTRTLGAGVHDFHVRYYQGPRTRIALELFWKVPGSSDKVYVPANVMSRP